MPDDRPLPDEFLRRLEELADSYLLEDDPIRQSGFGGGPTRWRAEREPLLDAVERDGDLIDVGCANGYLLECLREWAGERGFDIIPHGLDASRDLIELARARLPLFASNMHVGNAWDWLPERRYEYVYSLCDCVPESYLAEYVDRLLARVVAPSGRLILGAYGSRSSALPPFDTGAFLASLGLGVVGVSAGGAPPVSLFAWVDAGE